MTNDNSGQVGWLGFTWVLSALGTCFSVFISMFGWLVHSTNMEREAECEAAFGPEATPLEDAAGGTLCHVVDGVRIAPNIEPPSAVTTLQSFAVSWPMWAYITVAIIVVAFCVTSLIKLVRHWNTGGPA